MKSSRRDLFRGVFGTLFDGRPSYIPWNWIKVTCNGYKSLDGRKGIIVGGDSTMHILTKKGEYEL